MLRHKVCFDCDTPRFADTIRAGCQAACLQEPGPHTTPNQELWHHPTDTALPRAVASLFTQPEGMGADQRVRAGEMVLSSQTDVGLLT